MAHDLLNYLMGLTFRALGNICVDTTSYVIEREWSFKVATFARPRANIGSYNATDILVEEALIED